MTAKKSRKRMKVAISLVIAFAMIVPAAAFADESGSGDGGDEGGGLETAALFGETGTPPYDPALYGRNEDNRYKGTTATDPYSADRQTGRVPPDVDVTYLNIPDPSVPHDSAEKDIVATVTNWDDEPHEARIYLQVYKEIEFDPFVWWSDNMESCYTNWTANDLDGDGNTWGWTDVRSASPTHSYHNVKDCVGGTYVGNSDDELVSRRIPIPDVCAEGKPGFIWLDFNQWIQGEISENQAKFEDYGNVWVDFNDEGNWQLLARYEDSGGEWVNTDPEDSTNIMYGTYDYDVNGDPIGIRLPYDPAEHDYVRIKFEWVSDPAINYEGWYIDDVTLKGMCGSQQELVWQEYKPVDHPLELDAFSVNPDLQAPFTTPYQKMVQFHLPFDPEDDATYFFEVYSELIDADDVDGHYDYNGSWMTDGMTGANYWNPDNGVNESIYFGIWHDGQADWINWDVSSPMVRKGGESVVIPIEAQVSNQGTVAEKIPYTIEVKKTLVEIIQDENMEAGDTDYYLDQGWNIGYFSGSNPDAIFWQITDDFYSSPTQSWISSIPVGPGTAFYGSDAWNFLRTPNYDMMDYVQQDIDVGWQADMTWSLDPTVNPGYQGHYSTYGDAIIFGTWDPINNVYLHLSSTEVGVRFGTQYQDWDTFTIEDIFGGYGGWSDSGEVKTLNDLASVHRNIMNYFGYSDSGYNVAIFFSLMTDNAGVGYPGTGWGGFCLDDMKAYSVATGETVWSTDGVTDTLLPGEASDPIEVDWEAFDYSDYTAMITTHVEDDWNTHFKNEPELAYMYNDEAITWDSTTNPGNVYIHTNVWDEDFEEDSALTSQWDTTDNTFGIQGSWEWAWNGKTGWQEDHYAWTGEGTTDIDGSSYEAGMDDCLVPMDEDGEIMTFDWTEETAVDIEFDMWNEIETYFDYLTLEISNDSGMNWWIVGAWNNLTNAEANQEVWQHVSLEMFNGTTYIPACDDYDPIFGWIGPVNVGITDEMTFRFHVLSDSGWQFKGAYIDDIQVVSSVNETIPYNGHDQPWIWTHDVLFEEDFENGLDNWFNVKPWTGSMWHVSDMCAYAGDHAVCNFDFYPYSSYNKHLYPDVFGAMAIMYDHSYLNYRNNADDELVLDLDLSGVYQAWLQFKVNYSFADIEDMVIMEVSTDGGDTWEMLGQYAGSSGGWVNQTSGAPLGFDLIDDFNYGIDISEYAGQMVQIRWTLTSNATGTDTGFCLDNLKVYGKRDTESPVTTAVLGPATPNGCNGWYTSDVTVTLNAQDREMGTTYYRIDGGSWLTYTGQFTIGIEGEHTIEYYSVDAVGNEEEVKSVSFKIDKTTPTGSLNVPQAGYIYFFGRELMPRILVKDKALIIGGLTATASASDSTSGVAHVTFSTSAGDFEDAVSPYQFNLPSYGIHGSDTLSISVTDNACNTASNVASVQYVKIL